jgi:TetR/AcrR family transcriptional regulator, mexJK operon transcriptional repressor
VKRRVGRPSQAQAGQIDERLLASATKLFLSHGYGATSIEAIAKHAGISKRTLYDRFSDKSELFAAVAKQLIEGMRPRGKVHLFNDGTLEEILHRLAQVILRAALGKDALALQRLMLAEAARFPELALIMEKQGARQEAVDRIAALLEKEMQAGRITVVDCAFAAEQFLQMVITVPQRRAFGLGKPMHTEEVEAWGKDTVEFFLAACRAKP